MKLPAGLGFMRMKHRRRFPVTGQDWALQVDLAAVWKLQTVFK